MFCAESTHSERRPSGWNRWRTLGRHRQDSQQLLDFEPYLELFLDLPQQAAQRIG